MWKVWLKSIFGIFHQKLLIRFGFDVHSIFSFLPFLVVCNLHIISFMIYQLLGPKYKILLNKSWNSRSYAWKRFYFHHFGFFDSPFFFVIHSLSLSLSPSRSIFFLLLLLSLQCFGDVLFDSQRMASISASILSVIAKSIR